MGWQGFDFGRVIRHLQLIGANRVSWKDGVLTVEPEAAMAKVHIDVKHSLQKGAPDFTMNLDFGALRPLHTRIAPSPTGDMHLGTARTAYFNWLLARSTGGTFMLRIDDTDAARNRQECVDDILSIMEWLGLDYDQLVYQSDRLDRYREVADKMVEMGYAQVLENGAVQIDPSYLEDSFYTAPCRWKDEVAGEIQITDRDLDHYRNLILIKGDGNPTYNFATVVDDIDFEITYILRGNDHTGNTSKQVMLWDILFSVMQKPMKFSKFAHVGLLFAGRKKLSKRDGASSMLAYKEAGVDPDALLNYMLRMGWGPKVDDKTTRTLDRQDALRLFITGGNLRNTPARIDPAKLASYDRKYKARKKQAGK